MPGIRSSVLAPIRPGAPCVAFLLLHPEIHPPTFEKSFERVRTGHPPNLYLSNPRFSTPPNPAGPGHLSAPLPPAWPAAPGSAAPPVALGGASAAPASAPASPGAGHARRGPRARATRGEGGWTRQGTSNGHSMELPLPFGRVPHDLVAFRT